MTDEQRSDRAPEPTEVADTQTPIRRGRDGFQSLSAVTKPSGKARKTMVANGMKSIIHHILGCGRVVISGVNPVLIGATEI